MNEMANCQEPVSLLCERAEEKTRTGFVQSAALSPIANQAPEIRGHDDQQPALADLYPGLIDLPGIVGERNGQPSQGKEADAPHPDALLLAPPGQRTNLGCR